MLNRDNYEYAKQLVESNYKQYPYYICVTNTNISDSYDYQSPAFKIYFSRKPITANGRYTFSFQDNALCYSVISNNASKQYHSERVSVTQYNSNTLSVNNYEFCYSNAEFKTNSIQPDLLATSSVTEGHFDGVSLILLVILLGSVVVKLIRG